LAPALPENIKLRVGVTTLKNNLAYCSTTTNTAVKSFIVLVQLTFGKEFRIFSFRQSCQNFKGFSGDFFNQMTMT
jgi:hypothetical protein